MDWENTLIKSFFDFLGFIIKFILDFAGILIKTFFEVFKKRY